MKAEAEAVTVSDGNTGGGGSGGNKDNGIQQWWVHRQEQSTIN
jgi:hypothetical protein